MAFGMFQRDRRLGVADRKRRYDLPLNEDDSAIFLMLLVGLMAFLATISLTSSVALNALTQGWSEGLENKVTIVIPTEKENGDLRAQRDIKSLQSSVQELLKDAPYILDLEIIEETEMQEMVRPWLGSALDVDDIPMPGLLSVSLNPKEPKSLALLRNSLDGMKDNISIETHESWLADLFQLAGSLSFTAFFIVIIIGATTIAAIAGATKSRFEIFRQDVELLHLMGARDHYITRQFQRQATVLALKGAMVGTVVAIFLLLLIGWAASYDTGALLPDFEFTTAHLILLGLVPIVTCTIAALSARYTVLRVLRQMP
jgi:cell division transport system permease protein